MLEFLSMSLAICRQDLQERFAGSLLGTTWVLIWPLVQLFIYILIFGRLMGARLGMRDDSWSYGFYIASGLLCWTCFAAIISRSSRCFIDRRHIISKVRVNLAIFPTAICLVELLPFAAGFCLLALADFCFAWRPDPIWLLLIPVAVWSMLSLAFGIGLFFACLAVFARDIAEIASIALQIAFWFTPIVYVITILPDWLARILWINPMYAVTHVFQQCFVLGGQPDWGHIAYSFIFGQCALIIGLLTLSHWRKDILDVL